MQEVVNCTGCNK